MKIYAPYLLFLLLCGCMDSTQHDTRKNFFGKQIIVDDLLAANDTHQGKFALKMQAFKAERILEIFIKPFAGEWRMVRAYPFCSFSGALGPKQEEGDRQIPEGIYKVAVFNSKSKFYLSMGLDYPNERDMKLANPQRPGSDIYIHGGCRTVGCIPITDEKIAELFLLAQAAQGDIIVTIVPYKVNDENRLKYNAQYPQWVSFWDDLFHEVDLL